MPKNIFYSYPVYTSFVKNDELLLKTEFKVYSFYFKQTKASLIPSFLTQLFTLCFQFFKTDIYVSFFAGYSSFLPGLFAKLTGRKHLIILGGTDCSSFPSINYGNFRKPIMGWFTSISLKMASHLAPVDQSLVKSENTFYTVDSTHQGYLAFCKNITTPYTTINIGYNPNIFYRTNSKIKNSFITLAQMTPANYFRKGIDLIFEVAPYFPDCSFTIVGNTDEMKYINIPENVILMPFIKYEELRELYSSQKFYFQLSIMEGFPSAPCEAMLCECIPIVSNVAALPNIAGNTGFILEKRNLQDLKLLIKKAIENSTDQMGINARERIITNFPPDTRFKLVELINSLFK